MLFALAAVVTVIAGLSMAFDVQPESSTLGIGVTVIALIIMPVLGWLTNRQPVPILLVSHYSALD